LASSITTSGPPINYKFIIQRVHENLMKQDRGKLVSDWSEANMSK